MAIDRGSAGVPKSRSHHVITAHRPAVISSPFRGVYAVNAEGFSLRR
jgi:hypothetical protein